MRSIRIRMIASCLVLALSLLMLVGCNGKQEQEKIIAIKDILFGEDMVTVVYEDEYALSLPVEQLLADPLVYGTVTLMMGGDLEGSDGTVEAETSQPDVESDTGVPGESVPDVSSETASEPYTTATEKETDEVQTGVASMGGVKFLSCGVRVMGTTSMDEKFVYVGGDAGLGSGGFANITVGTGTSSGTMISPGSDVGSIMGITALFNSSYIEINGKKYATYDTDSRFADFFAARLTEVTVKGAMESSESDGIPNAVDRILSGGFANMKRLEKVTLPDTLKQIESKAFLNCEALKDIFFTGTVEQWKAIRKSANWNEGTGDYTVHCADGDLLKSEDTLPSVDDEKK